MSYTKNVCQRGGLGPDRRSDSKRKRWLVAALLLSVLWGTTSVAAEDLEGRILDPAGQPVSGALVRLAGEGAEAKETRSDSGGRFVLAGALGTELMVRAEGFRVWERSLQSVMAASDGVLEIRLRLAPLSAEVEVTAVAPGLIGERSLSAEDLNRQGSGDVGAQLRSIVGLGATRRGTINLDPNVRGLQEGQVAMLVDGTRTAAAGPARMDSGISHVGPEAVQTVRVVQGPYALTWGPGVLSAIELVTRRPALGADNFRTEGQVRGSWAENGEVGDVGAVVQGAGERNRFVLSAGLREGGDYESGDGSEIPGDYRSEDLRWRFGRLFGPGLLVELSGGFQDQRDLDYPGRLLDATLFTTRSHALELTWSPGHEGSWLSELYGQLYSNHKSHRMNNDEKPTARPMPGRIPPFGLRVDLPTESDTEGARLRLRQDSEQVSWTWGGDYSNVQQQAERSIFRRDNDVLLFSDIVWPDAEIEALGAFAQAMTQVGGGRLGLGVRLDEVDASAGEVSPFFQANVLGSSGRAGLDASETQWGAALSYARDLGPEWMLSFGLGRAQRSASALERYSDRFPATKFQIAAEFLGNPQLDPETSTQADLGLRGRAGSLEVQVDLFYRLIDDYITVNPDPTVPRRLPLSPTTVYRYVNGDRATYRGGELSLKQPLGSRFAWHGSLAYVWAEDEELDEPVLGIAPLTGRLALSWTARPDTLWLDLAATLVDRQDRVATSRFEQETPGYGVLDLVGRYQATEAWLLRLSVENLGDRQYSEHLNAPNPFTGQRIGERGRTVRFAFEVNL